VQSIENEVKTGSNLLSALFVLSTSPAVAAYLAADLVWDPFAMWHQSRGTVICYKSYLQVGFEDEAQGSLAGLGVAQWLA
nr:hypothetical protein [Tanacetum cinerariifolium]